MRDGNTYWMLRTLSVMPNCREGFFIGMLSLSGMGSPRRRGQTDSSMYGCFGSHFGKRGNSSREPNTIQFPLSQIEEADDATGWGGSRSDNSAAFKTNRARRKMRPGPNLGEYKREEPREGAERGGPVVCCRLDAWDLI